jgi:hypothetical protein
MESIATLESTVSDKTNHNFGDDAHSQGWSSRNLVLDTPENLPTKGLERSKSLNNF